MTVVLLKLVFSVLSTISNIVTRLLFTVGAHVLVQMIQALKVPGEGSQRILEQVKNMIQTCLQYLLDLIIEVINTVFSSMVDLVKEGVSSSSSGLAAGILGLMEKSKNSLDHAVEDIPQVLEAFVEMVAKIVTDFWNNCNDALSYVSENVLK